MATTRTEYKTVETRTLKGLKQAERLQRYGWKIERTSLFSVLMSKKFARRQS
jgi:hypothetical protein